MMTANRDRSRYIFHPDLPNAMRIEIAERVAQSLNPAGDAAGDALLTEIFPDCDFEILLDGVDDLWPALGRWLSRMSPPPDDRAVSGMDGGHRRP